MMSFAHMHAHSYANALQKIDGVQIAAIYDDNESRGKTAAEKYQTNFIDSLEEFLALEIDAVIICSENILHHQMVIQAAKAGKHILCEKPIATTIEEAEQMIAYCERQNVILQIAFPVRFLTSIRRLKNALNNGELGDIVAIRTTNRGSNPQGWFIDQDLSGGGAVLDHTVHMVDIMRWYLGSEVKEVYSLVDSFFHNIDIDDAGILTLKFENGVIATHDASWSKYKNYPTGGDITIEVIGTKKTIKANVMNEHVNLFQNKNKSYDQLPIGNDMNFELINDFIMCLKENRQPFITGMDGMKALEVALAAYESTKTDQVVKL